MKLIRSIHRGICSLVFWLPTIWADRHWDQVFLYRILRRKLQGIRREMNYAHNLHEVAELRTAIRLLDGLIDDVHSEIAYREYNYHRPLNADLSDAERSSIRRSHKLYELLIGRDIEYLFSIMRKHIRTWWW